MRKPTDTKTKTQHTPGPWTLGFQRQEPELKYWKQTIEGLKGWPIRPACANGATQAQVEANARLIAAAPELLEAAKATADWLNDLMMVTRNPNVQIGLQAHRDILLVAIAKAQGGKSNAQHHNP